MHPMDMPFASTGAYECFFALAAAAQLLLILRYTVGTLKVTLLLQSAAVS